MELFPCQESYAFPFSNEKMREKNYIPWQLLVNSLNRAIQLDDFCYMMDINLKVVRKLQLDDFKNKL
ncbi:MAG: hypothetical protein PHG94_07065 [Syntrophomonas sp.]|uniref:hypothetical protein n=1 Tax=Syntrophomonas sp. TaxID=2053627 RepID=UPI00260EF7BA|nr:hypothetical protein [Syntrophomonas sp.]MDD2510866.1 hypothetical protein [Syntrophomonas sp.]MDD4626658.1 hypothetical protein [Syntrophomonas sp.]